MNIERRKENNEKTRAVILSGDVHVSALGVINEKQNKDKIHQVVSSGIVHTSPSYIHWLGISSVTKMIIMNF